MNATSNPKVQVGCVVFGNLDKENCIAEIKKSGYEVVEIDNGTACEIYKVIK